SPAPTATSAFQICPRMQTNRRAMAGPTETRERTPLLSHWKVDGEGGSPTGFAIDANSPAIGRHDRLTDAQAQPGARSTRFAAARLIFAIESVEDLRQFLRGNTNSCVGYAQGCPILARIARNFNIHVPTRGRKLDRVVN